MYITVKTIKRNLGFKGIEISDVLIAFPILAVCILMFVLSSHKILAIVILIIGGFMLLPINVSKKNRMYKVLGLIFSYYFRVRNYIYTQKELTKGRRINIDEIKRKLKY